MKLWELKEKLNEIEETYGDGIEVVLPRKNKHCDLEHIPVVDVSVKSETYCAIQRVVLS